MDNAAGKMQSCRYFNGYLPTFLIFYPNLRAIALSETEKYLTDKQNYR